MGLTIYQIVYIITNISDMFIVRQLMHILLPVDGMRKKAAAAAYFTRFIITTSVYLLTPYPIVSLLSSFIMTFIITLCYRCSIGKKLLAAVLTYLTMFASEAIVAAIWGLSDIRPLADTPRGDSLSLVLVQIIALLITVLLSHFRKINKNIRLPWKFVITATLTAAISVWSEIRLFMEQTAADTPFLISLISMLMLNFMVFYLYDLLSEVFSEKMRSELLMQQTAYSKSEAERIRTDSSGLRLFRHDIKNKLIVVESYINSGQYEKALHTIQSLSDSLSAVDSFSATGNFAADSIINYKLTIARQAGITIRTDIVLPKELSVDGDELAVILGNLLDNAAEAAQRTEKGYIDLHISYEQGNAFIVIKNNFSGEIRTDGNRLLTTKKDKTMHGLGLESVEKILGKYGGGLVTDILEGEFTATVLLPA